MKLPALAVLILAATPALAHAGGGIKAHLECTPAGGKILKTTQKAVLDKDVSCAVVVDGGTVPAGAVIAVTSTVASPAGPILEQHHAGTASGDGKRYASEPFKAGADFVGCAAVTFEGSIYDPALKDKPPVWKKAVTIQPPCGAPVATHGKLKCVADTDHGMLTFPGNGDATKADLSDGLTCTLTWSPDAGGDVPKWGAINVHGSGKPAELRPLAPPPGGTALIAFAQLIRPVFPACKPFVVEAALLRADGAVLATFKQPIAQACAKP
jgi:hypothetical protein